MGRIVNQIFGFVRNWNIKTFYTVAGLVFVLGVYFIGMFLKANKKESAKVAKISYLLISIFMLIILILLFKIRT